MRVRDDFGSRWIQLSVPVQHRCNGNGKRVRGRFPRRRHENANTGCAWRPRSNGAARSRAGVSADHRRGRTQGDSAAALRGQGSPGCAERCHRPHRRHRVRSFEHLWRTDQHAHARADGGQRASLQPVPHDGALLADANGSSDRSQPPREQRGGDHGARHRVSRAIPASVRKVSPRLPKCCG